MRGDITDEELVETCCRYLELQEEKEQLYVDFAESLQEDVDEGKITHKAADLILQVITLGDDFDLAKKIYGHALMFPQWEPDRMLVDDETLAEMQEADDDGD